MNSPNIDQNAPESLAEIEKRVLWLSTAMIPSRQPCPSESQRAQGRRPSGLVRVDGLDHDVPVVRPTSFRRPGFRQAACGAGAPRHQLSARRTRRVLTGRLCANSGACRATRVDRKILIRWIIRPVRWVSARRLPSGAPSLADTSTPPSAAPEPGVSTPWSVTPNSTRARCGKQFSIIRLPNWVRSCG